MSKRDDSDQNPLKVTMESGASLLIKQMTSDIRRSFLWEDLVAKETNQQTIRLHLTIAQNVLSPPDVLRFFRLRVPQNDPATVHYAAHVLGKIADKLDVDAIVAEFPDGNDTIQRALINAILPIPLSPAHFNFLAKSAASSLPLNRESFLNVISKAKEKDWPSRFQVPTVKIIEALSHDHSLVVQTAWLDPALHFLRNNQVLPRQLLYFAKSGEVEMRKALASRFDEVVAIEKGCECLFNDQKLSVIASLIPKLKTMKGFTPPNDPVINLLCLRYIPDIDDAFLARCLGSTASEVLLELCTFAKRSNRTDILMELIRKRLKDRDMQWRLDYELLELDPSIIGPLLVDLALICAERHPHCLRERAVNVIKIIPRQNEEFGQKIDELIDRLKSHHNSFDATTVEMLNST